MNFTLCFKRIGWKIFSPCFLLTCFGLLSIYSSSLGDQDFSQFKKQLIFLGVSLVGVVLVLSIDLRILKANSYLVLILFGMALFSLLGLFFLGSQVRGVRGWYKLGPVSLDPVPFATIILGFVLSKYFSRAHIIIQRFRPIFVSGFYTALPTFLVLAQPDLGASLGFIAIWLGILLFSGIKLRHFLLICLVFVVSFIILWGFFMKDYQKERLFTFLNKNRDPQGAAWNIIQSQIAIGSGGFLGKGFGQGSQVQLGFLPEPKTDFIFSAIAEEFGFLGVGVLLLSFIFLFYQIFRLVLLAPDNFSRLFASGLFFLLASQTIVNIGMSLGLLPIVGLPLPFVSYGGSYLVAFYIALAIATNIARS